MEKISKIFFGKLNSGEGIIILPEITKTDKPDRVPKSVKDFMRIFQKNGSKPALVKTSHGLGIVCRENGRWSQDNFKYEAGEHFGCIVRTLAEEINI